jgi:hypothetical protein
VQPDSPTQLVPPVPRVDVGRSAATGIQWPQALRAAALAVLVAAIPLTVLGLPLGLGMLASGFFSVVFYRRRSYFVSLTAAMGARLGAVSGALGFGLLILLLALGEPAFHSWEKIHQTMLDILERSLALNPNPQGDQIVAFFKTPEGFTLAMIMVFVAFLISSGVGGALGAVLLRKKERF